jgi:hypothetical protein
MVMPLLSAYIAVGASHDRHSIRATEYLGSTSESSGVQQRAYIAGQPSKYDGPIGTRTDVLWLDHHSAISTVNTNRTMTMRSSLLYPPVPGCIAVAVAVLSIVWFFILSAFLALRYARYLSLHSHSSLDVPARSS